MKHNDGAVLSRAAFRRYPHGDLGRLESMLAASKAAIRVIASDTVFSMDGDIAPVAGLLALAERHDAWLVLDDAHGIGVLGGGRGALAHAGIHSPRIVYMATLGKALGGYGAFVAGEPAVVEWLMQRARTYVFSTALPPAAAAVAAEGEVEQSPVLDPTRIEDLLASLPGQPQAVFLQRMLETFRRTLDTNLTKLQQVDASDLETVRRAAHTLKSAAAQVGAMRLSHTARELEYAARDHNLQRMVALGAYLPALANLSWQQLKERYPA